MPGRERDLGGWQKPRRVISILRLYINIPRPYIIISLPKLWRRRKFVGYRGGGVH